jgi:hypothetical protein
VKLKFRKTTDHCGLLRRGIPAACRPPRTGQLRHGEGNRPDTDLMGRIPSASKALAMKSIYAAETAGEK